MIENVDQLALNTLFSKFQLFSIYIQNNCLMKKLIEKFKSQPLALKLIGGTMLLWAYPFIESFIVGAGGFGDLSIVALILLILGGLIFLFLAVKFFIMPVGYWIGLGGKWVINLFKKKK